MDQFRLAMDDTHSHFQEETRMKNIQKLVAVILILLAATYWIISFEKAQKKQQARTPGYKKNYLQKSCMRITLSTASIN